MTTHSPTTLLRAARLAYPDRKWFIEDGSVYEHIRRNRAGEIVEWIDFNPHDTTKGDLAALNEALLKAGWEFGHSDLSGYFEATWSKGRIGRRIEAPTPTELAMLCVEAMP